MTKPTGRFQIERDGVRIEIINNASSPFGMGSHGYPLLG